MWDPPPVGFSVFVGPSCNTPVCRAVFLYSRLTLCFKYPTCLVRVQTWLGFLWVSVFSCRDVQASFFRGQISSALRLLQESEVADFLNVGWSMPNHNHTHLLRMGQSGGWLPCKKLAGGNSKATCELAFRIHSTAQFDILITHGRRQLPTRPGFWLPWVLALFPTKHHVFTGIQSIHFLSMRSTQSPQAHSVTSSVWKAELLQVKPQARKLQTSKSLSRNHRSAIFTILVSELEPTLKVVGGHGRILMSKRSGTHQNSHPHVGPCGSLL